MLADVEKVTFIDQMAPVPQRAPITVSNVVAPSTAVIGPGLLSGAIFGLVSLGFGAFTLVSLARGKWKHTAAGALGTLGTWWIGRSIIKGVAKAAGVK